MVINTLPSRGIIIANHLGTWYREAQGSINEKNPFSLLEGPRNLPIIRARPSHYPKVISRDRDSDTKPSREKASYIFQGIVDPSGLESTPRGMGRHPLEGGKQILDGEPGAFDEKSWTLKRGFSRRENRSSRKRCFEGAEMKGTLGGGKQLLGIFQWCMTNETSVLRTYKQISFLRSWSLVYEQCLMFKTRFLWDSFASEHKWQWEDLCSVDNKLIHTCFAMLRG